MINIVEHFITFYVNGVYHYIVKLNNNGELTHGILKSDKLVEQDVLLEHLIDSITVHSDLSILINHYVDLSKANKVTCNTTGLDINHNENFISFQHGLRPDVNGYKINIGDLRCPDWDSFDIPSECLYKIVTKHTITYILKTKENVTVVS